MSVTHNDETDDPEKAQPLNGKWLRALFLDLFGRPPLAAERKKWLGKTRDELVEFALGAESSWRHWLDEQLYYFMLIDMFRPVGTTLDELPLALAKRKMTPRDVLHRVAISTSFDQRNPGADTFVTVVMEQLCGLEVQRFQRELEIGKSAYDGNSGVFLGSSASSQSDVVTIAIRHKDAAKHFVAREHERLCRVPIARKMLSKTARLIQKDPAATVDMYTAWFRSEAYAKRVKAGAPVSNYVWVRAVFVDLSDALPEDGDVEALRSALDGLGDPAPLRSAMVRMFLNSDGTRAPRKADIAEPKAWIDASFERLLGRPAAAAERDAFLEVLASGDDGPELCLYTLMTSAEYETP